MKPSPYQQAIFDHISGDNGNLIVEAVAGSGKTTTIVKSLELIEGSVNFVAFNKRIAEELSKRVPEHVKCSTLHSYGFNLIKKNRGRCRVDKYKVPNIVEDIYGKRDWSLANPICKIISLFKSAALVDFHDDIVDDLMDNFLIDEPKQKNWRDILQETWFKEKEEKNVDFDDMIYIPVAEDYEPKKDDWVFVDEVQDLNMAQMILVEKMANRIVAVGDSRQAIYGFRGADALAMSTFKNRINATELPLSICYRCGSEIVKEAQKLVPEIESSWEGGIVETKEPDYQDGDYVLCRVTAPLVSECLNLLGEGKKAVILGREIGDNLLKIVKKIGDPFNLDEYDSKQRKKLKGNKLQNHIDTIDALRQFDGDSKAIAKKISEIFSDTARGITLCTIHKSKGLEADRVWILRSDLLPHPRAEQVWQIQQEQNLHYVAITRAKKELYYVAS